VLFVFCSRFHFFPNQKLFTDSSQVKNTSRQIGGWISTAFTEPQRYFLWLYRFQNVNSAAPALERLSDLDLPRGQIHGELLSHQIYESENGVFLIAKDGHRVRDSNKLFGTRTVNVGKNFNLF
jgi:hypothetical protein